MPAQPRRQHLLTVNLEDYFQVGAFNRFVQRGQWYRFESRLGVHAERTLALLDRFGVKATFFVLGWAADNFPDVVRMIADRGHEVASRGYYHRNVRQMTPDELRSDLGRARDALERVTGRRVIGYRTADGWFGPDDLWALDVLAEEGYSYDSSIAPLGRRFRSEPWRRYVHRHKCGTRELVEVPISAVRVLGQDVPVGGGNWVRQLPRFLMRRAAARWDAEAPSPFVLYFHTWELDREQPRISTAGWLTRVRHYRNLAGMEDRLADYLGRYQFVPVADYLGLDRPPVAGIPDLTLTPAPPPVTPLGWAPGRARQPVTIVVPLYNEELIVPYLANTLKRVREAFAPAYDLRFVLVDDGSRDNTWAGVSEAFGRAADVTLLRHDRNRGVAAAILTGLRRAETEVVCSMDADCTYDPHELLNMIPLLADGVDMVTASPYHPQGQVRNVPGWRLLLSKTASRMYRLVLRNRLHTYTSCFRVYRRAAVTDLPVRHGNFLGVVELLGHLDLAGGRVVEHPATLEVRMLGRSKMKTLRTILGHLRLMAGFAARRLFGRPRGEHSRAERDKALQLLIGTAAATPCHAGLGDPAAAASVSDQTAVQRPLGPPAGDGVGAPPTATADRAAASAP